jgi:Prokaryotic glutathione synthetase, ATP-grasp domain
MQKSEPTRNLLIIQTPPLQDPADWVTIKQRIERDAPDIEVRIANNGHPNSVTARWQVRRPSLVFSPIHLINFVPCGGAIFCGHILGKDEQLRRLSSIDILTPKTVMLSSVGSLDPSEWSEFVVVKPNNSNSGKGVRLVRSTDLSARYNELTTLANDQILVQPYIDHAEEGYPTIYRVLTMFGRALYCVLNRWDNKRPRLAQIADDPFGVIATNDKSMGQVRAICNDPEIVALGERAHKAFPECPVLGVDIIRDIQSGRLYVLEVNPHGAVWHLSSLFAKEVDPEYVRARYAQFNALDRAADLLIQKTRTDAR